MKHQITDAYETSINAYESLFKAHETIIDAHKSSFTAHETLINAHESSFESTWNIVLCETSINAYEISSLAVFHTSHKIQKPSYWVSLTWYIYLEDNILVPVTKGRPEGVGGVGGGGSVEDHGPLADTQGAGHRLPLAVRRYGDRAAAVH